MVALFKLYKLKGKLARFLLPYSRKIKKTKKVWLKKQHIFVLGPMVHIGSTLLQKTEYAHRKRLVLWSRNSIYSTRNATADKQYDRDRGIWKSQNGRNSTIFATSLLSNGNVFDKIASGMFLNWVQHYSQEVSSKSVTSTFLKCNSILDSYVQRLLRSCKIRDDTTCQPINFD